VARVTSQSGQATLEWTGLVLLVALAGAALAAALPALDGRSLGGLLAHRLVCAARGGCTDGHAALVRAYGARRAALVRDHAPGLVYEPGERQLPVDYRRCRRPRCAHAPDDRDLDAHRSDAGEPATVFTRVVRRGGRRYIQYWLYYPDSNTAWAGSDAIWRRSPLLQLAGRLLRGSGGYPGYHRDDWESYQVRIDSGGSVWARASSHGHYQGCKQALCHNRWIAATGWTRVSRGSHAGHIPVERRRSTRPRLRAAAPRPRRPRFTPALPGVQLRERTSTADGLRLVPLETHDTRGYRPRDASVTPPWRKQVYREPASDRS
jgi:hypothetical protein